MQSSEISIGIGSQRAEPALLAVAKPTPHADDEIEQALAPLLRFACWGAGCAAVVLLIAHLGNAFLLGGTYAWLFDANEEGTPLTWLSVVASATTAVAALIGALTTRERRTEFVLLATTCAFLSLDDAVELHERVAGKLLKVMQLSQDWDSVLWPAVYVPLLLLTAVLIVRVARSGSRSTARIAVVGLALLGAAVLAEVVSAPWSTGQNIVHTIEGGIEEALELAGWILIAAGVMTAVLMRLLHDARPPGAPANARVAREAALALAGRLDMSPEVAPQICTRR